MQRFALLGAGFIGSVHAANLAASPDVDFALVYDVDHARAAALAKTHGVRATLGIEAAFDPGAIDAVFIASSTDTHAEHLRRAADAGIAVPCEKPIDLDLNQATEVVKYLTQRSTRAMVDFNRRFDRDYMELKRVVDSGEIGDVELIQLSTRGPSMPTLEYIAVSGGQMRNQTVHFFDLARWIADLDPTEVFATGSTLAEPRLAEHGDVDTSVVTLRLPTGALVQIDSVRRVGYGTPAGRKLAENRQLLAILWSSSVRFDTPSNSNTLPTQPMDRVNWTTPKFDDEIDRRVMLNPGQSAALLRAVGDLDPAMVAFFATRYFEALRPGEVLHLRWRECKLTTRGCRVAADRIVLLPQRPAAQVVTLCHAVDRDRGGSCTGRPGSHRGRLRYFPPVTNTVRIQSWRA